MAFVVLLIFSLSNALFKAYCREQKEKIIEQIKYHKARSPIGNILNKKHFKHEVKSSEKMTNRQLYEAYQNSIFKQSADDTQTGFSNNDMNRTYLDMSEKKISSALD